VVAAAPEAGRRHRAQRDADRPSAQFGLWLLPPAVGLGWQLAMFCAGMLLVALATGLYIGASARVRAMA
jgi:hypothetical protein